MIKEAIEKVLSLAPTDRAQINGLEYEDQHGDRGWILLKPPVPAGVSVTTLDGLVNLLEAGLNGFDKTNVLVHVKGTESVSVEPIRATAYAQRVTLIESKMLEGVSKFNFNNFMSQEAFVIGLQSCFVPSPELAKLLDLASHIDSNEKVKLEDNGVAQGVELRRSLALKEGVVIEPRVKLSPYRTFREVEQPASDFIFRVKDGGMCALFEADGGAWKLDAIARLATWLSNRLKGSVVEGLADIPVIS